MAFAMRTGAKASDVRSALYAYLSVTGDVIFAFQRRVPLADRALSGRA